MHSEPQPPPPEAPPHLPQQVPAARDGRLPHPPYHSSLQISFDPPGRSRWRAVVLGLVLLVLFGLMGAQTYWLYRLSGRLDQANAQAAAERQAAQQTVDAMASRVATLEQAAFHPDQIAQAALYQATIVAVDEDDDLAHLTTAERFPGLTVSPAQVKPGQPVVVVGAPLGLESSVTTGVVSALRKLEGTDDTYVQFDAPINPGNSGGPVINAQGQVVGIATAKLRDAEGIGLAIPIELACQHFPICGQAAAGTP